jgi:GNAT superfamily N-acetyltransferase
MAIPCVVIDLKTNKRYTIDQFAAELHNGLLKELVNESIVDNTKLKGRTELLNVSPKATEEVKVATKRVVEKAFNSVKNLIEKTTGKKAKLEYAKNRDEMIALVKSHGGTEADATARGYYYGKDGSIVINEEFATSDTGYHEPTHPIWDVLEAHHPEVLNKFVTSISKIKGGQEFIQSAKLGYPTLEGELPKLRELLEKAKADGKTEVADKLQQRIDNINRDINQQKKEIVTDFFAKIADGTFKVDQTNYEMVRDYVLQTLKAIGIKLSEKNLAYLDQKALMDLVKVISDKFEKGEEITAQDLGLEKFELISEQARLQQMKSEGFETGNEPSTFTTRTGEKIGYTYDTDKVARERFDFSKLKRLGGGSDRDVFDLGDGKILKVAKTARGLEQNIYEGDSYLSFVPEVYERGLNYVVAERAEAPLVSNKGGAELQAMLKDLSRFTQKDFDNKTIELQDALEKYGLEDATSYDVLWNDFTAKRNWGLKDGQPIHVDGGTFGGVRMLDRYRGKTNLSDPEFRQIYNQSKDLKKQFGDTDKFRQFSKSEVGEVKEPIEFSKELEDKYGVTVDLTGKLSKGDITLSRIEVPKGDREEGIGTQVMQEIIDYADKNNKRITLTASEDFGGDVTRLKDFYKRFGFVENKGVNKDFTTKDSMYRNPEPTPSEGGMQFSKSEVSIKDRSETPVNIDDIKEGYVLHRGTTSKSDFSSNGFNSLDEEGGINYGKDGNVVSSKIKEGANILKLVIGDTDNYKNNKVDIDKFYSIVGEDLRNQKSDWLGKGVDSSSDITTKLWDNPKAVAKLKKAGIDIIIGETIDGADAYVINENAVERITPSEGGMQFSKSEIPNAPKEVSIKNAAIDEARAARGAEPVATQARQTWGKAWDQAVTRINNGESPEILAKDIARSPRALNDVEHAMLFMNELDLNNKYWNLIDQINKGEGDIKNLETQLQDVKRKLEDNEYAIRASGTETARGLAIRRWSKKANYSAEALKAEARAANKGVELDTQTSEALENKAKEIQKAQEASDEYDAKMREKEEERRMKEAEAAEKKAIKELEEKVAFKTATRDEINTYIDKRRNKLAELIAARDEAKGGIQRAKSEAPINYEELIQQEIKEIAKGYFSLGNMDMNSLVKAVYEDLQGLDPSFTERDVRDAISGYKGNKPRMTKPAIDVEMQDLKSQMKKMSEIEDYNKNNPSRVKKEPAPKSKALTDLENQLADKVKEQKLFEELEQLENEGLPEPKTRGEKRQLSQDIQDLEQMIAEKKKELGLKEKIAEVEQGKLPEKGESTKKELSPELQKLQDDLNNKTRLLELSNELEQLESEGLPAPKTPKEKQQLSQEVADLEKQVADKKTELKGKDAKKKRLLELSNELQSLEQNGLPAPKTPKAKAAVDQDIQDLKNQISEKQKELKLKGKIADVDQGKLPQKGQPKAPLSDELQALQDEYNKKKRLLEITKEFEEFKRYGSKNKTTTKKEVDADVKAIQDQLAEGKRIESLMKNSWDLDRLDQDVNLLKSEIDRLRQMGDDVSNQLADDLTQELNDLIEANKKKPKESKPKTQTEIDLRNKIKKKEKELGIDGADEAKLKAAKTRMQNRINELQYMIDTRNFDKPEPKPVALDAEGLKLKAELEEKKREADMIIEEERRKNMTKTERAIDDFNKWSRAVVLSGVHVLFKLPTAGFTRTFVAQPLETILGAGLAKLMPNLYKNAVLEGRDIKTVSRAAAKAGAEWFRKENWLGDDWFKGLFGDEYKSEWTKVKKTGVGTLDEVYGDKKYGLDDSKFEYFGRLHAALKSPTKRAEWLRSWELRTAKAIEMGEDINNPDVEFRIGAEAYVDAMNSIFMGDNAISTTYTNIIRSLEARGTGGKLTAAVMKLLVPVVKIPTNYVLETGEYAAGGLKGIYTILKNGFDNLTPEQTDIVLRSFKRQGVGAGMFILGRMFSDNIGGYYQQGEKRGREDVKPGDIKIGDFEIPHYILHSPLFEVMMMGATYQRMHDKAILEGKSDADATIAGTFDAATGLGGQIPQFQPIQDINKAMNDEFSVGNFLGGLLNRTVVPQGVKDINTLAFEEKTTEGAAVKRSPRGFTEQVMKGVPFVSRYIPIKMADYVDVTLGEKYKESISVLSKAGALDDLKDIETRKYLIYNPTQGTFKPIYLDRTQMNQLNQKVRDKFIELIKENPVLSANNPLQAFREMLGNEDQQQFDKLTPKQQGIPLKNMISELLSNAKAQVLTEKGYQSYDEKLLNQE